MAMEYSMYPQELYVPAGIPIQSRKGSTMNYYYMALSD
jgi:hypothetical protein